MFGSCVIGSQEYHQDIEMRLEPRPMRYLSCRSTQTKVNVAEETTRPNTFSCPKLLYGLRIAKAGNVPMSAIPSGF
jgi:hypothetical protein